METTSSLVDLYRSESERAFASIPRMAIEAFVFAVTNAYDHGGTVFACGNGGSAGLVANFVNDLNTLPFVSEDKTKLANVDRGGFQAVDLGASPSAITGISNDLGFSMVYAVPLKATGKKGDLLVAVSGSGTSKNIVNAVTAAKDIGMAVVGITRGRGSNLEREVDTPVAMDFTSEFPGQTGGNNANMHLEDAFCRLSHLVAGVLKAHVQKNLEAQP